MAWTATHSWAYKEAPSSTVFNAQLRDNMDYLKTAVETSSVLGYAEITSNFVVASTIPTDVPGLTVTVTIPSGGGRIKITAYANTLASTAAISSLYVNIKEGAAVLQGCSATAVGMGSYVHANCVYIGTPTAGSHTYKVNIQASANDITLYAATNYPAFILVEYLG
jgi:hypothetical protein